ncbi:MAG: asparaginase [Eggerthellaceae bacterium]|nr:asparaginase [Eggerthellaceae bacterium]
MTVNIGAPRILIVYIGGTIGMTEDLASGTLVPFSFEHLLKNVPKIGRLGYFLDHVELDLPIDSSSMNPVIWASIANMIGNAYDSFDGFVILHGTDTMAYTASALSFMLSGLAKPVILTGSQLPIGEIREDGTENLITALQIAAAQKADGTPQVQEVAISFGRHLWRGNRTTKISSTNFGAFRSFNYPALADMDLHIVFHEETLLRPDPDIPFFVNPCMDDSVSVIALYPGITESVLRAQLDATGTKGIVLLTFGSGNAPTATWFTDLLSEASESGKVIVNITQCPSGGVEEKRYATGDALAMAGVVSGYDMTCEAALTKLMHLFGEGLASEDVKAAVRKPIAGEITCQGTKN